MSNARGVWIAGAVLAGLALTGCGGGGHSDDSSTTIHGRLASGDQTLPNGNYVQRGSYVDVYSCVARQDGTAQIDLKSSDFDGFLVVGTEDSNGAIQTITTDNNSGDGTNARVKFQIYQDTRYFVAATDADGAGKTGGYELDFSSNLRDIREEPGLTPAILAAAAHALEAKQAEAKQAEAKPAVQAPATP